MKVSTACMTHQQEGDNYIRTNKTHTKPKEFHAMHLDNQNNSLPHILILTYIAM